MAGIYVHIPFCRSRCLYCGFYSTVSMPMRQRYVDAVCREYEMRRGCLDGAPIHTIYIGGGTPSQLTAAQLSQLLLALPQGVEELTVECNPDDVDESLAVLLASLGVNRVSMGVQTFDDRRLSFLHRRHASSQIAPAVAHLRGAGIGNISIDLMFGFPGETLDQWDDDITRALQLDVPHISAYSLQYEEDTPLYRMLEAGQISEIDEELSRRMYYHLVGRLEAAGYEHYEISNFARRGFHSRHNSNYWNQTPYLGLGAAAHSYNGTDHRQWNVADVHRYVEGIECGKPDAEGEYLDADTRYNELVMTALRTRKGISLAALPDDYRDYCMRQAQRFLKDGLLCMDRDSLRLTHRGLYVSDMVMSDLMRCED